MNLPQWLLFMFQDVESFKLVSIFLFIVLCCLSLFYFIPLFPDITEGNWSPGSITLHLFDHVVGIYKEVICSQHIKPFCVAFYKFCYATLIGPGMSCQLPKGRGAQRPLKKPRYEWCHLSVSLSNVAHTGLLNRSHLTADIWMCIADSSTPL